MERAGRTLFGLGHGPEAEDVVAVLHDLEQGPDDGLALHLPGPRGRGRLLGRLLAALGLGLASRLLGSLSSNG
jgi:hypothetical protein